MSIRVSIYEDNEDLRNSVVSLFGLSDRIELCGAHTDCSQVLEQVEGEQPDVILMDIDMPGRNGIEAVQLVKAKFPATEIIMFTVFDDNDRIFNALRSGASGYLLKKTSPARILEAIEDVYQGGAPMTSSIARKVLQYFPKSTAKSNELELLSAREQEILNLLVKGLSYKMIAAELTISIDTVRTHIKRIYEKLQVHSVAEAISKTHPR